MGKNSSTKWKENFLELKEHQVPEKPYCVFSTMVEHKHKRRHIVVKFQISGPKKNFHASREEKNLSCHVKSNRNKLALDFTVGTLETQWEMEHHFPNSEGK